jgi:hypothetical protein
MGNDGKANAKRVAMIKTGNYLLTSDTCSAGHDITDKVKSISMRKRYGKQDGQFKPVCRQCENEYAKQAYRRRVASDKVILIDLIKNNPELVEPLLKVAKAIIGK